MNTYSEPLASGIPEEARTWAMICHLAALLGLLANGIGFLLGPLLVWLVKRKEHSFVDDQGKEAVNFQITMIIAFLIAGLLSLVVIGLLLLPVLALIEIVMPILAGLKANNGERYRYPFAIRLIS